MIIIGLDREASHHAHCKSRESSEIIKNVLVLQNSKKIVLAKISEIQLLSDLVDGFFGVGRAQSVNIRQEIIDLDLLPVISIGQSLPLLRIDFNHKNNMLRELFALLIALNIIIIIIVVVVVVESIELRFHIVDILQRFFILICSHNEQIKLNRFEEDLQFI